MVVERVGDPGTDRILAFNMSVPFSVLIGIGAMRATHF